MEQLLVTFGDVKGFFDDNGDIGLATRTKLLEILNNPMKTAIIQIELAAIIDAGAPLVKALTILKDMGCLCGSAMTKFPLFSIPLTQVII